jgi:hypothetical protein
MVDGFPMMQDLWSAGDSLVGKAITDLEKPPRQCD